MVITKKEWTRESRNAALITEAVGTFCIVFFGGWAYLQNEMSTKQFNWTAVAITQGLFTMFAVWGGQAISGGHFSWGVTLTLAGLRKMPPSVAAWYLLAQTAGSFLGAVMVDALTPEALDNATYTKMGVPRLNTDKYTETVGFFCEFIGAAIYMFMVMAFNFDHRMPKNLYGMAAGGASILAIVTTGPISGGSINPVRIIGPILVSFMTNNKNIFNDLHTYWFYFLGPLFGALLMGFYYEYFILIDDEPVNDRDSVASYEMNEDTQKLKI